MALIAHPINLPVFAIPGGVDIPVYATAFVVNVGSVVHHLGCVLIKRFGVFLVAAWLDIEI